MPSLSGVSIYPCKALDGQSVQQTRVLASGALEHDRRFAIVDRRGHFIAGKSDPKVHRLRSHFDLANSRVDLRVEGTSKTHSFDLESDRQRLCAWLGDYFGIPVDVQEDTAGGFPDDLESPGPTLISTATLETVGGWFGLDLPEARRRFRANLEIDADVPFWEDRLVTLDLRTVRFRLGEVELFGTNPCQRCPVPSRDSQSGLADSTFPKGFAQRRRETLPAWAPRERFDHFYRLAVNTRLARILPGTLTVGDQLTLVEGE